MQLQFPDIDVFSVTLTMPSLPSHCDNVTFAILAPVLALLGTCPLATSICHPPELQVHHHGINYSETLKPSLKSFAYLETLCILIISQRNPAESLMAPAGVTT